MKRSDRTKAARGLNARVAELLAVWFESDARDLPWRDAPPGQRDPYRTLVSEAMLQQTQVSRVIEKFTAFLSKFPNIKALAAADEREVMALWAGLGYYRRARNLQAAAREVVNRFDGRMPRDTESLMSLPGVGRYTAGAIASLACGVVTPIVDGNVTRVLMRVHGHDVEQTAAVDWAWEQAGEVAAAGGPEHAGACNEAMMELGATVCTPSAPSCDRCPLSKLCAAHARGLEHSIPRPKPAKAPSHLHLAMLVIRDRSRRMLIERRPAGGLWGGLWQIPTLAASAKEWKAIRVWLNDPPGILGEAKLTLAASLTRRLTHRNLSIEVWTTQAPVPLREHHMPIGPAAAVGAERQWRTESELIEMGTSNAHRAAIELAVRSLNEL